MEDYVHRIGRTGRAGNKGKSVTFITPEEKHLSTDIIRALTNSGQDVPPELQKLEEIYNDQVKKGDISKKKVDGFNAKNKGFKFSAEEKSKVNDMRGELSKNYE